MTRARGYRLNLLTEIAWWTLYLSPPMRAPWMKTALSRETRRDSFPGRLRDYLLELPDAGARRPRVLDVGCGPLSPLAWGVDSGILDLTAVDPLARVYRFLLGAYRLDFPVTPVPCAAERLLDRFAPASFDAVYSRNALDHVEDADLCIANICALLTKNGRFFFDGITREGTRQKWRGLHKHDFYVSDGRLMWSGEDGKAIDFSARHGLALVYQNQSSFRTSEWFRLEFERRSP